MRHTKQSNNALGEYQNVLHEIMKGTLHVQGSDRKCLIALYISIQKITKPLSASGILNL
jgi:hypothetical protein